MAKIETWKCDLCGTTTKTPSEFWAELRYTTCHYTQDGGDEQAQIDKIYCRKCRVTIESLLKVLKDVHVKRLKAFVALLRKG
jgi:hypothetical protein